MISVLAAWQTRFGDLFTKKMARLTRYSNFQEVLFLGLLILLLSNLIKNPSFSFAILFLFATILFVGLSGLASCFNLIKNQTFFYKILQSFILVWPMIYYFFAPSNEYIFSEYAYIKEEIKSYITIIYYVLDGAILYSLLYVLICTSMKNESFSFNLISAVILLPILLFNCFMLEKKI